MAGPDISFFKLVVTVYLSSFYVVGKGVNLVMDCVGGSMYEVNVNALALDGRWVVYGLLGQ